MLINSFVKNKTLVVAPIGDIDHSNIYDIKKQIKSWLDKGDCINLIIDFERVEFIDSSGIGIIIGRYKEITSLGGRLIVSNIGENLERIFILSGLYRIIDRRRNLDEALSAVIKEA
jgi:stage II sporulation protein AA (anti-sigma F factor antagonist)